MASRIASTLKQKLLPNTLFGRSLMIIATPILLMQMIVSFIFFDRHWESMSGRLIYALAGEVSMLTTQMNEAKGDIEKEKIIAEAAKSLDIHVMLERFDPAMLQETVSPFEKFYWFSIGSKLDVALDRRLTQPFMVRDYDENSRRFKIVVQLDEKRMLVFLCPERRLNSSTTYIFILWLIGSSDTPSGDCRRKTGQGAGCAGFQTGGRPRSAAGFTRVSANARPPQAAAGTAYRHAGRCIA